MSAKNILVLGATGGTGRHVVGRLLEAGHSVTALVRDPARLTGASDRLRVRTGDVTRDGDALSDALRGQDVVISTLGVGKSFTSGGLIEESMRRLVPAMEAGGVRRLIHTSAFGVGETMRDTPVIPRVFIRLMLQDVYRDKSAGEAIVRGSGLDWTIVYPVGLKDAPATGRYRVGERLTLKGFPTIPRADVADCLVKQVDDLKFVRKGVLVSP